MTGYITAKSCICSLHRWYTDVLTVDLELCNAISFGSTMGGYAAVIKGFRWLSCGMQDISGQLFIWRKLWIAFGIDWINTAAAWSSGRRKSNGQHYPCRCAFQVSRLLDQTVTYSL